MPYFDRRTGEEIRPFGYELDSRGVPVHGRVDLSRTGDHGCDPIGDGTFRMVPSGDVVTYEEMRGRLGLK